MVGVHDRLHCHRLDSHANSLRLWQMGHRALPVLVLDRRCLFGWVACRATNWAYGRAVKSRKLASSDTITHGKNWVESVPESDQHPGKRTMRV